MWTHLVYVPRCRRTSVLGNLEVIYVSKVQFLGQDKLWLFEGYGVEIQSTIAISENPSIIQYLSVRLVLYLINEVYNFPTCSAPGKSRIVGEITQIKQFFVVFEDPKEFSKLHCQFLFADCSWLVMS